MEQSIDSNKKPEFAAGTDPAFIPLPGLAAPVATRKPETESEAGPKDTAPEAEAERDDEPGAEAAEADADQEPEAAADDATAEAEDEGEAVEEGPVFEVSDRRGSIRVAREGVRFTLDDQEAEFHWDEIGAVETTAGALRPPVHGHRPSVQPPLVQRRGRGGQPHRAQGLACRAGHRPGRLLRGVLNGRP